MEWAEWEYGWCMKENKMMHLQYPRKWAQVPEWVVSELWVLWQHDGR